ncbi:MAG: redoxin family protein [Lacunisphaera sp.]
MKSLKFLSVTPWLGLAAAVLLFAGLSARAKDLPALVNQIEPAWKLTDLNGHAVGSAELKGKVVVLDFWATWCVPCIGEIPGYIELQKKYGSQGLVIVGVSVDTKKPDYVNKFVHAKGMNYTVAMADDSIGDAFGGLDAIPTTFLINREGRIVNRKVGAMPKDEYEKLVVQALK